MIIQVEAPKRIQMQTQKFRPKYQSPPPLLKRKTDLTYYQYFGFERDQHACDHILR